MREEGGGGAGRSLLLQAEGEGLSNVASSSCV